MRRYSTEPRTKRYVKGNGFLSIGRKYEKQLLDRGLDTVKTSSKKVVDKASEFVGNKLADTVTKSNDDKIEKQEPVEETMTPPVKKS